MEPEEKLDELRGIVLGEKIDHPSWDWMNEKFRSLRADIVAQQSVHRTALPVRILNAICYGTTLATFLWLLFGSR